MAPTHRPSLRAGAALAALGAALLVAACSAPRTDRDQYPAGEAGRVTFENVTGTTLWLAGCSHFAYEQQVDGAWLPRDPQQVCVWEGFAEPLAAGDTVRDPLDTQRAPGLWRVRYPVGIGCDPDAPLSEAHCDELLEVTSNAFEIGDDGCMIGGCSSELCGERGDPLISLCVYHPSFACYRKTRCGRFGPGGTCAWEPTPELQACLAENPPGFPIVELE